MTSLRYEDLMSLPGVGWPGKDSRPTPEPGSPAADKEKRALEAWKRQLEQRVKLIEERLELMERAEDDD